MQKVIKNNDNIYLLQDNCIEKYVISGSELNHISSIKSQIHTITNIDMDEQNEIVLTLFSLSEYEDSVKLNIVKNENVTYIFGLGKLVKIHDIYILNNKNIVIIFDSHVDVYYQKKGLGTIMIFEEPIKYHNIIEFSNGDVCISINNFLKFYNFSYFQNSWPNEKQKVINCLKLTEFSDIVSLIPIEKNQVIYTTTNCYVKIIDFSKKKQIITQTYVPEV